jgi:MFS family permease
MSSDGIWREVWRAWYPFVEGAFYFCQGFYTTGFVMYLSVFTVNIFELQFDTIAMLNATITAPVFLKMIPLAFCDRYSLGKYGRRRPYIMIAAIAYAVSFALLAEIQSFGTSWVAAVVISILAWVVADGCFDALTVDVTPPDKAGLMQGIAWGSRGLGAAIGGAAFALMVTEINWPVIVMITGVFAIVQCFCGIIMKEPRIMKERLANGETFKNLVGKRETWLGFVYAFLASTGLTVSEAFGAAYFVTQGHIDGSTLGYVLLLSNVGIFFGSLLLGSRSDKIGTKKALILGNLLAISACALLASIMPNIIEWILVAAFLIGAFQGAQMTSMLRLYMELSPSRVGGTMFAVYTSIGNAGMAILGSLTISLFAPVVGAAHSMLLVVPYMVIASLMLPLLKLYDPKR